MWSLLQADNSFRVTEVRRCVRPGNFKNEESVVFFGPQRRSGKESCTCRETWRYSIVFKVVWEQDIRNIKRHKSTNRLYLLWIKIPRAYFPEVSIFSDCLCGLVLRVSGYRYRDPGFDPRPYQIFWVVVGLERGPLSLVSLVSSMEELLEWKK